ncbi:MAG: hypothetical protein FWG15_02120, partial [Propionibacteriaceae bacterium]|nr:hypothetical protein [Propionibacteriaceae bacterium]
DGEAATVFGELAALVLATGRHPRPRRMDLMIAATAAVRRLPLYTANPHDFTGLEAVLTVVPVQPATRHPAEHCESPWRAPQHRLRDSQGPETIVEELGSLDSATSRRMTGTQTQNDKGA